MPKPSIFRKSTFPINEKVKKESKESKKRVKKETLIS
jgi:hypothetical protein